MDSFTKKMFERAQQRREALSKKLEKMEKLAPVDISDDSSENDDEVNSNEVEPNYKGAISAESAPERNSKLSRLAALTESINGWEDQTNRPEFKVTAPPKKAWKPPARTETAAASLILRKGSSTSSGNANSVSNCMVKSDIRRSSSSASPKVVKPGFKESSALTSARSSSFRTSSTSSSASSVAESETVNSITTITEEVLANSSANRDDRTDDSDSAVRSEKDVKSVVSSTGIRQNKRISTYKTNITKGRRSSVARRSEDGEPTRQPVAARLAAWKQKSKEAEKTAPVGRSQPSRKPVVKYLSKIDENAEKENMQSLKKDESDNVMTVPQNSQLDTKAATIGDKSGTSPKKLGQATLNIQAKLSQMCENWKQNQISEKSRQERAAEIDVLANRWKNGILIDERNTDERIGDAEIGTCDKISQNFNPPLESSNEFSSVPPPPPPLPPPPPVLLSSSGSKTNLIQGNSKSVCSTNASISRAIKFNSCPKPFVKPTLPNNVRPIENKMDAKGARDSAESSCDLITNCLASNFESNLIAMGYKVCSDRDAAMIELNIVKHPDVPKIPASKSSSPPTNRATTVKTTRTTARLVTSTRFDDREKVTVIKKKVATLPLNSISIAPSDGFKKPVDPMKSASLPKRSASSQSVKLYDLIKAHARQTVETGTGESSSDEVSRGADDARTGSVRPNVGVGSVESGDGSVVTDSSSDHSDLEQTLVKTPVWESDADRHCSSRDNLRQRIPDSATYSIYDRSDDSGDKIDDELVSTSDESTAKINPSAIVDVDRSLNDNVYMEMTPMQTTTGKRQQRQTHQSPQTLPLKTRRVQFASDTDTTSSAVSDSDDGALSSSSSAKYTESCDDTYDVIWDSEPSSVSSEVLPKSLASKPRTDKLPDLPMRKHAGGSRDRPVTVVGLPAARPRQHKPETRDHMAAFVERRYQQRRPACHGELDRYKSPSVPHKSVRYRLQSLQESVRQEEKILVQATNALSVCSQGMTPFVGTSEAVECHRILLVSSKKRETLLMEMKRLREGLPSSDPTGLTGRLTAADIRLPLKPEFIAKIGTVQDTSIHYFVLLLRSGINIAFAQTVSTLEPMVLGSLDVLSHLHLTSLPENFIVDLEIYAMVIPREHKSNTPKKNKMANKQLELLTPKSARKMKHASANGPAVHPSNFVQVASLELTKASVNKTHFALDGVAYACPLQGTIHLKLRHTMETFIHHRGYLKICVEGSDVWNQRWCTLNSNEMVCWKHPNDELNKEPALTIDLRSCITGTVAPVSLDDKSDRTALELITVRSSCRSAKSTHSDNIFPTRFWLVADTSNECLEWSDKLNHVLNDLRAWHPYANPSVRMPQRDETPFH